MRSQQNAVRLIELLTKYAESSPGIGYKPQGWVFKGSMRATVSHTTTGVHSVKVIYFSTFRLGHGDFHFKTIYYVVDTS